MAKWEVASDIADRLEELRVVLDTTQADIAKRAGVWPAQANNWFQRKQRPPRRRLEEWAEREGWPVEIFQEGGQRPAMLVNRSVNGRPGEKRGKGASPSPETPTGRRGTSVEEMLSVAGFDPGTAEPEQVLRFAGFWFAERLTNDRDAAKGHDWLRHVFEAGKRAALKRRKSGSE